MNVHACTLTLLLIGMLTLAFNIQPAKASGTIYIRADGSVEPDTAPISSVDNVTYTFSGNIYDGIVVERDNIVVDGAGYTVQGSGGGAGIRIRTDGSNITVKNVEIKAFMTGISFSETSDISIINNSVTSNLVGISTKYNFGGTVINNNNITSNEGYGIHMRLCNSFTITNNNISSNGWDGIFSFVGNRDNVIANNIVSFNGYDESWGYHSGMSFKYGIYDSVIANNTIFNNNWYGFWGVERNNIVTNNVIFNNWIGMMLSWNDNTITNNLISNNEVGIEVRYHEQPNIIYHNNFINNIAQVRIEWSPTKDTWDEGYPSGGNYWSDYEERYPGAMELDDSGIWDTPYEIDDYNQDNYPLMEPYSPIPRTIGELKTEIEELGLQGDIDNQGIVKSLIAKLNLAQKLVDKGKIDEAKSILEEDFIPQVHNLTDIHITSEAAEILIESAEYIMSHL